MAAPAARGGNDEEQTVRNDQAKVAGRCVIVADDEHPTRMMLAAKFREAGFDVVEARDGEEALALARERTPDLLVTDLQMPFMGGLELCQKLKADPASADVPALLITARGYVLTEEQVVTTNIREVINKPFSAREVLRKAVGLLACPAAGTGRIAA